MRWTHSRIFGFLTGVLVWMLSGCSFLAEPQAEGTTPDFVLTYAENQAEDYPTTLGAYRFAELVSEKTDGRVVIQIHAGGTMGDEQSVVEQLQFGGVDFARVSISSLSEFVKEMNVLQLPYLYTGSQHMWKILDGQIGDHFLEALDGSGMVGLSWYDAGARNFYTSTGFVRTPDDLAGQRIRVQESVLMARMVEAFGGEAVQQSFETVYSALEKGQVDGAENNWPSYESEKHYEVAPYVTVDEHTRVPEMQLVSQVTWDKLPEEYQEIIRDSAQESAQYERELWQERTVQSRAAVVSAGCQVLELSSGEKEQFRQKVLPLYREFCADYLDLVDEIVAAGR